MCVIFAHLRLIFAGSAQHILLAIHICGFCAACLGPCEIQAHAQCSIYARVNAIYLWALCSAYNMFANHVQHLYRHLRIVHTTHFQARRKAYLQALR